MNEVFQVREMISLLQDGFTCDSRVVRGAWNRVTLLDACDRMEALAQKCERLERENEEMLTLSQRWNGKLYVAAPELLAACERFLRAVDVGDDACLTSAAMLASAAVARAGMTREIDQ